MSRLFFFGLFLWGFLFVVFPLSVSGATSCSAGFTLGSGGICFPDDTGLSSQTVSDLLINVMKWLLRIVGIIAIIAFVISGLQYFLASGDEKMAETAKRNMQFSVVGIVVALSGLVIITAIDQALQAAPIF